MDEKEFEEFEKEEMRQREGHWNYKEHLIAHKFFMESRRTLREKEEK